MASLITAAELADCDLILASGSPRRREIIARMGLSFKVVPADIDESVLTGETPADYVRRMAYTKALTTARAYPQLPVLGADTAVILGDVIFGKPHDRADAKAMLRALSGRTHQVMTAVSIVKDGHARSLLECTQVTFAPLDDALIDLYVASGECDDKSGSYALQGIAAMLIERVEGSVSCVVGLPACQTRKLLAEFGLQPRTVAA